MNNLGVYEVKDFEEITDAEWLTIIETNFLSGVRLSRHYLPRMKAAGWGRMIFISSESAVNIPVEMIHYGVTKTMQVALARGLAETTAGTGVTVNSLLVGPTRSEGVEKFIDDLAKAKHATPAVVEKEFFTTARPTSLLRRFATPDELQRSLRLSPAHFHLLRTARLCAPTVVWCARSFETVRRRRAPSKVLSKEGVGISSCGLGKNRLQARKHSL